MYESRYGDERHRESISIFYATLGVILIIDGTDEYRYIGLVESKTYVWDSFETVRFPSWKTRLLFSNCMYNDVSSIYY